MRVQVSLNSCQFSRFNTDDGIRRAAIAVINFKGMDVKRVSIPMTVLGGLQ